MKWLVDFFSELGRVLWAKPEDIITAPMNQPVDAPETPKTAPLPTQAPPMPQTPTLLLPWENKKRSTNNRHNIRVIADQVGLTYTPTENVDGVLYSQKDIFTACVYQESEFYPLAIGKPNYDGSKDWGLCQYNDNPKNGWVGPHLIFENTQEVLTRPEKNARIMAHYYKQHGHLNDWSSYHTGAYKKWLKVV